MRYKQKTVECNFMWKNMICTEKNKKQKVKVHKKQNGFFSNGKDHHPFQRQ